MTRLRLQLRRGKQKLQILPNPPFPKEGIRGLRRNNMDINEAVEQFYKALNALIAGDIEPMKEIWLHEDYVTYLDPSGAYLVGWENVLASWQKQADMNIGGDVHMEKLQLMVEGNMAVAHNYEIGNTEIGGKREHIFIRATNVFLKRDGQWKMISHHTDKMQILEG
jgi:ketosteroid isomerase-like protein